MYKGARKISFIYFRICYMKQILQQMNVYLNRFRSALYNFAASK